MAEANRGVRKKQTLRHITDFAMILLVLALMAYSVTGQEVHEWMGVGMFLLFLLHHGLNAAWFRSLTKGRYTPLRVLQAALVLLLLVSVAAQIVSGLAMARYALPFLNIPISTSTARLLHLACGYWSFLLMGLHLGLHWSIFLGLGRKLRGGRPLPAPGRWCLRILAGAAAIWGAICFVQQNIADYLFLRTEFVFFDYEKFPLLVLGELAAIMALWTLVGYLLQRLAVRNGKSPRRKD